MVLFLSLHLMEEGETRLSITELVFSASYKPVVLNHFLSLLAWYNSSIIWPAHID